MLNRRFKYDRKPTLKLSKLQLKYKQIIEEKIDSNKYIFEKVNCVVCDENNFELLAEKDRYGLYVPTVICRCCGLVQTNPKMNQESYNKFYTSEYRPLYCGADIPTEKFFQMQMMRGKTIYNLVSKVIGEQFTNKFVVEIGTGAGGILQLFKERGNEVFGVDLDSNYIDFGMKKGLNLKIGKIDELKIISIKPDLVIYSQVLEHILDPVKELQNLKNYLKPTSLVSIEVPSIRYLKECGHYEQDFLRYLQNAHVYHFTLKTLNNVTNKAGFSLIYGNEKINSIFKMSNSNENYNNDYDDTIKFLKRLEMLRILRLPYNFCRRIYPI